MMKLYTPFSLVTYKYTQLVITKTVSTCGSFNISSYANPPNNNAAVV